MRVGVERAGGTAAVRDRGSAFANLQRRFYWYCLWPAIAVLIVVTLLPTLYLLVTSFTPLDLTRPDTL